MFLIIMYLLLIDISLCLEIYVLNLLLISTCHFIIAAGALKVKSKDTLSKYMLSADTSLLATTRADQVIMLSELSCNNGNCPEKQKIV